MGGADWKEYGMRGGETNWLRWGRMAGVYIGWWWGIPIELVRLYFSLKMEKYITVSELGRWHDGFRKIYMKVMYRDNL